MTVTNLISDYAVHRLKSVTGLHPVLWDREDVPNPKKGAFLEPPASIVHLVLTVLRVEVLDRSGAQVPGVHQQDPVLSIKELSQNYEVLVWVLSVQRGQELSQLSVPFGWKAKEVSGDPEVLGVGRQAYLGVLFHESLSLVKGWAPALDAVQEREQVAPIGWHLA